MIFLTVGTQLPFDRLVAAVDRWAQEGGQEVFAQIGLSSIEPKYIRTVRHLNPTEFDRRFREARAIVSHAGIGTILTALQMQKPIVIMPRLSTFGEHRNDHQLATVQHLCNLPGLFVAMDETELPHRLNALEQALPYGIVTSRASDELIETVRSFVER